jgi:hypothetical protein
VERDLRKVGDGDPVDLGGDLIRCVRHGTRLSRATLSGRCDQGAGRPRARR